MKAKLKKIVKLNQKKKGSKEQLFYFILNEMGKHIDEVKELKINKDPHLLKEIADMVLLSRMLSINEDVGEQILNERIKKIEDKLNEN